MYYNPVGPAERKFMLIPILCTVMIVALLAVLAMLVYLLASMAGSRREVSTQSGVIGLLQQQLEGLKVSQDSFSQAMGKNMQTSQQEINKHLISSKETLTKLQNQLGGLDKASLQMLKIGDEVRKLQDVFKNPKHRGQLGERSLENLLKTILPAESYAFQYSFKNGSMVDAIVKLPDYIVPVDAKFPLTAFEALMAAEDDEERERCRRGFLKDVKNRIDEIASKYINPDEGTLDFALMYIPAENVYYEAVINCPADKTSILDHALEQKVIPVSPNLLYAYLMTIVMGLHGMQIEEQAAEIRKNLNTLTGDLASFVSDWGTLGGHIKNTENKYSEADKKLNKFTAKLDQIRSPDE